MKIFCSTSSLSNKDCLQCLEVKKHMYASVTWSWYPSPGGGRILLLSVLREGLKSQPYIKATVKEERVFSALSRDGGPNPLKPILPAPFNRFFCVETLRVRFSGFHSHQFGSHSTLREMTKPWRYKVGPVPVRSGAMEPSFGARTYNIYNPTYHT